MTIVTIDVFEKVYPSFAFCSLIQFIDVWFIFREEW